MAAWARRAGTVEESQIQDRAAWARRAGTVEESQIQDILSDTAWTGPQRTDTYEPRKAESILEPDLSGNTEARATIKPKPLVSDAAPPELEAALPMTAGLRKINCVVGQVMRDSVVIHCDLPSGRFDLRLPSSLVPIGLMNFGTPISISLSTHSGIRTPIIEARPIDNQAKLPGQDDVEAWLNSP
jgi:hypothetical protein